MSDAILRITKADLDADGYYVGSADVSNFDGSIEIDGDLGWVRFKRDLRATRLIAAKAGAGIKRSEERRVGKECRSRWSPYH